MENFKPQLNLSPTLGGREDVPDRPSAQVNAASQSSLKNETMGMKKPRQNAKEHMTRHT